MARRDFRQPLGDEDIRDALVEPDPPLSVPFYQNSSSSLTPSGPQQGERCFKYRGEIVRTVTVRGTPQGTNVHVDILGNVGAHAVTVVVRDQDSKAPYAECVHADSGRKTTITFPVIDITGGGGSGK